MAYDPRAAHVLALIEAVIVEHKSLYIVGGAKAHEYPKGIPEIKVNIGKVLPKKVDQDFFGTSYFNRRNAPSIYEDNCFFTTRLAGSNRDFYFRLCDREATHTEGSGSSTRHLTPFLLSLLFPCHSVPKVYFFFFFISL